ncbi:hypothetical protein KSD_24470 [Ktedonobacter sp. SOSP1-85]|nr:hypothetical protein KSD_24470 [Ktedonobacter sp. SOSP1-85]
MPGTLVNTSRAYGDATNREAISRGGFSHSVGTSFSASECHSWQCGVSLKRYPNRGVPHRFLARAEVRLIAFGRAKAGPYRVWYVPNFPVKSLFGIRGASLS